MYAVIAIGLNNNNPCRKDRNSMAAKRRMAAKV